MVPHSLTYDVGFVPPQETLRKLELTGGPDAYINIKYLLPTYESAVV